MSKSDNTRPPKFGGRQAFNSDPERMSNKGHPRESFREDEDLYHRRDRRTVAQALSRGDEGSVQDHRHDVLWDRW